MRPNKPKRPDPELIESLLAVERMRTIERVGGDPGYLQPYWEWTSRIAAGLVLAVCYYAASLHGAHSLRTLQYFPFLIGFVMFPNAFARFMTRAATRTVRAVPLVILGWVVLLVWAWPYLMDLAS